MANNKPGLIRQFADLLRTKLFQKIIGKVFWFLYAKATTLMNELSWKFLMIEKNKMKKYFFCVGAFCVIQNVKKFFYK